jgi:hypothetical protein
LGVVVAMLGLLLVEWWGTKPPVEGLDAVWFSFGHLEPVPAMPHP